MTIKLLAYYGHFPVNSLVTLDATTAAALIDEGSPPVGVTQQWRVELATTKKEGGLSR